MLSILELSGAYEDGLDVVDDPSVEDVAGLLDVTLKRVDGALELLEVALDVLESVLEVLEIMFDVRKG